MIRELLHIFVEPGIGDSLLDPKGKSVEHVVDPLHRSVARDEGRRVDTLRSGTKGDACFFEQREETMDGREEGLDALEHVVDGLGPVSGQSRCKTIESGTNGRDVSKALHSPLGNRHPCRGAQAGSWVA